MFFFTTFASMIELDRHITRLLLSNDCVIVPDFGGFMAHHVEARFDETDSMFLPPMRTIGFNPQLKLNDSLLAQSYIEAYDLSYPEALARINDEVVELKQHIENEGDYELNNLGVLSFNEDGNYLFEPCASGIMTPSLYGLSGFQLDSLETLNQLQAKATMPLTPSETSEASDEETEDSAKVVSIFDEDDEDKNSEFFVIKKSWVRNMVAACIAVIAFFVASTPLTSPLYQQSQLDTNLLFRIMPKEITKAPVLSDTKVNADTKTLELAADEVKPEEKKAESLETAKPYYSIVLASRVTKRNAALYAESLQADGFKDARVLITASNVKVIYGSYETENEAYNALNALHHNDAFKEGWITKVKE